MFIELSCMAKHLLILSRGLFTVFGDTKTTSTFTHFFGIKLYIYNKILNYKITFGIRIKHFMINTRDKLKTDYCRAYLALFEKKNTKLTMT